MAKLSPQQRKNLSKSQFVFPKLAPDSGSYPIPDAAHAESAIRLVIANGSPEEKKAVFAAVKRRFPDVAKRFAVLANAKKKAASGTSQS